jgi:hypothetical protein
MVTVFSDSRDDRYRRDRLYAGDIFVFGPTPASDAFCAFARELIRDAFPDHDPELAQHEMPVSNYASVLAELKPRFIHHAESKRLIREILTEHGCDADDTYFDVPRLRSSTSDGYLTTGIAYAFHPHRDTWYSAPLCQVNWWMPVFALDPDNGMAFHPRYWGEAVLNSSDRYNYQDWTSTSRFTAVQHVKSDTREQPHALERLDTASDLRLVLPVGSLMAFSAAQLHSSVTNMTGKTRFSIDFRTIARADAEAFRGAPNIDSACTGTALTDFLRVRDLAPLPAELVDRYLGGHPQGLQVAPV